MGREGRRWEGGKEMGGGGRGEGGWVLSASLSCCSSVVITHNAASLESQKSEMGFAVFPFKMDDGEERREDSYRCVSQSALWVNSPPLIKSIGHQTSVIPSIKPNTIMPLYDGHIIW